MPFHPPVSGRGSRNKSQLLYQLSYRPVSGVSYTARSCDVKKGRRGWASETLVKSPTQRACVQTARDVRGERPVHVGARARVRQFGGEYEDRARDRLHLLVVDLVGRVRGAV